MTKMLPLPSLPPRTLKFDPNKLVHNYEKHVTPLYEHPGCTSSIALEDDTTSPGPKAALSRPSITARFVDIPAIHGTRM